MKTVLQRVLRAAVRVDGRPIAEIGPGAVVFVGIEKGDGPETVRSAALKTSKLRMFSDPEGKSNRSLQDVRGQVLVVPQFTLAADLSGGNRPGFETAEKPALAEPLVRLYADTLRGAGLEVREGRFGAHMEVELVNDGPVTYLLP